MSQERLVGLSIISIEHKMCRSLDTYELVEKFASMKARKVLLKDDRQRFFIESE